MSVYLEDQAATRITVLVGGEEYQAGATVDLDSDGVHDTALVRHDDGSALAYTDTDGDRRADLLTVLDPRGAVAGEARYDVARGWVGTAGSVADPRTPAGGGQLRVESQSGSRDVGPPSHDTDGDGTADTVVVTDPGVGSVLYTDVDADGDADIATEITSDGRVTVSEYVGDGQWTVVERGRIVADGSYRERTGGRADDASLGFGSSASGSAGGTASGAGGGRVP